MRTKSGNLKFLFVIDNLSTGGAQRQLVNLATGLKARGYQIEVFCYAQGEMVAQPLYEMEIPVHWRIKRSRFSIDVIVALGKLIDIGNFRPSGRLARIPAISAFNHRRIMIGDCCVQDIVPVGIYKTCIGDFCLQIGNGFCQSGIRSIRLAGRFRPVVARI